jgi:hypothetical protein
VDLYIHSLISLHGLVLNLLSTGTTLLLPSLKVYIYVVEFNNQELEEPCAHGSYKFGRMCWYTI